MLLARVRHGLGCAAPHRWPAGCTSVVAMSSRRSGRIVHGDDAGAEVGPGWQQEAEVERAAHPLQPEGART